MRQSRAYSDGHTFQGREDKHEKQGALDPCLSYETISFFNNLTVYKYLLSTDSAAGAEETSHQVEWQCPPRNSHSQGKEFTNQADLCLNRRRKPQSPGTIQQTLQKLVRKKFTIYHETEPELL